MNLFRKLTALRRDQATPATPSAIEPFGRVDTDDKRVGRWGLKVLLIGFGGFVLWAALAPLDEGVTANGSVIVASNRQTVQHLTGGSVEKLLVNEGDVVRKGQALLTLNDTEGAQVGSILAQFITARAIEDRCWPSARAAPAWVFLPSSISWGRSCRAMKRVQQAKQLQTQLFHTRRDGLRDELQAQDENIKGLQEQLRGLQGMKAARAEQSKWQDKELEGIRDLAAGGYVPKNRLYQLERGAAEIRGQLADTISSIGRVQDAIAETRLRQLARKQEYQKEVESQLTDIQKETATLRDRLAAQRYVLRNSTIRAPLAGRVLGLKIHTVGGVVQAGQPLMEVVPDNQPC
jgi:protease secretion system membrane fusion protein